MVIRKENIIMKKFYILISLFTFLLTGCEEDNLHKPYGPDDGIIPGKVEVLSYTPTAGGAIINFRSPDNEDLMYIVAKYKLASGKEMESRVSAYSSSLKVEGFGNTEEKQITLYAVDRKENIGEPVNYNIVPLTPSYIEAYNTLEMNETFGGIAISMQNPSASDLAIEVITPDSLNQWSTAQTNYTAAKKINITARGYKPEERMFGVIVRDRWDNATDTVFATVTPWEEYELDKGKFNEVILDNDIPMNAWGHWMGKIWNGSHNYGDGGDMAHSPQDNQTMPIWFTFDLGVTTHLSRYLYWQRLEDSFIYQHGNMKEWEVWGRADKPDQSGSWDGWTLLTTCESYKPSGLPVGQFSNEDKEYASAGEEFVFPADVPAVRYIRFKALSRFTGVKFIHLMEVTFYGKPVENK